MLIFLGAILLGLVALVGFVIYLAAMAMVWITVILFFFWAVVIGWIVGDPSVGVLGAFPVTWITFWLFMRYSEANESQK